MSDNNNSHETPFIYNLFPSLVGDVNKWFSHVERAADMGFNWLFINPIHLTGASGSLYSIRDYFSFSPIFFPQDNFEDQKTALRGFVEKCRSRGIEVMVDLVINHTAYDNPLTRTNRNWYKIDDNGSIKNPGAADDSAPGGYVVWGDLSEIDNENSSDKHNLYEYWWRLVEMFIDLGVTGFRGDAAYQIPNELWKMLIERAKSKCPQARFFAESLGCPMEQTVALSQVGHDYVFNSGKWWNYRDDWFVGQLGTLCGRARSICFPESHDTQRLASEWNMDLDRVKQHYLFTGLISSGIMITLGFEYGFRKKPHVVETNPIDYEGAHYDLTDYIRDVNAMKRSNRVFQEDNRVEKLDSGNSDILALKKTTLDGSESVLMLFNTTGEEREANIANLLKSLGAAPLVGVSIPGTPESPAVVKLRRWGSAIFKLEK